MPDKKTKDLLKRGAKGLGEALTEAARKHLETQKDIEEPWSGALKKVAGTAEEVLPSLLEQAVDYFCGEDEQIAVAVAPVAKRNRKKGSSVRKRKPESE